MYSFIDKLRKTIEIQFSALNQIEEEIERFLKELTDSIDSIRPIDGVLEASTLSPEKRSLYFERVKQWRPLSQELNNLMLSRSLTCTNLLSIAKQTLVIAHGSNPDLVPKDMQLSISGTDLKESEVIWAGRNQGIHYDDADYNSNVINVFKKLNVLNEKLDIENSPSNNFSYEILQILNWQSSEDVLKCLNRLVKSISKKKTNSLMFYVFMNKYDKNMFTADVVHENLRELMLNSFSKAEYDEKLKYFNDESFENYLRERNIDLLRHQKVKAILKNPSSIPIEEIATLSEYFYYLAEFIRDNLVKTNLVASPSSITKGAYSGIGVIFNIFRSINGNVEYYVSTTHGLVLMSFDCDQKLEINQKIWLTGHVSDPGDVSPLTKCSFNILNIDRKTLVLDVHLKRKNL